MGNHELWQTHLQPIGVGILLTGRGYTVKTLYIKKPNDMFTRLVVWCFVLLFCGLAHGQLRVRMDPAPVHGTFASGQPVTFHVRDMQPTSKTDRLPELVIERVVWCATTNRPFRPYSQVDPENTGCNSDGYVRDETRPTGAKTSKWACEVKPMDEALAPIIYVELHTSRGVVTSQYRIDTSGDEDTTGQTHMDDVTWSNLWSRLVRHTKANVAWYTIALTGLIACVAVAILIKFMDRVRSKRQSGESVGLMSRHRVGVPGLVQMEDSYSWDGGIEESDDSSIGTWY